jgi:Tol biopolymer transport system component
MTPRDSFDTTLARWLDEEATGMAPAGLHDDAMKAVRAVRQRPMWLVAVRGGAIVPRSRAAGRSRLSTRYVLAILALALLAAALAIIGAGRRSPSDSLSSVTNGRIMFARERTPGTKAEYVTVRPDGTDEVRFLEADQCGQCTFWSPDGSRIMIPLVVEDRLRTATIAPDGTGQVVLAFPSETLFLGPGDWSRDGQQIALEGFDPSDPSLAGIFISAPDGSGLGRVTTSDDGRNHNWPRFSPDGRRIVYIAADLGGPSSIGFAGDLFIIGTDGSGLRQLNSTGTKAVANGTTGRPIDWSPDGRQLVFAAIDGPVEVGRSAVFVVGADGGDPVRISEFGTNLISVDWSPDGQWVAYGEVGSANELTWIAHPDGSAVRQLTGPGASLRGCCATWSPDGTRLLFQRFDGTDGDLWTMDVNGNALDQITHNPGVYIWYSWAPEP